MQHPNIFDTIALRIYPRYLYRGQIGWTLAKINVGIVHKIPQTPPYWKIMDNIFILKGSWLKYLGLARDLHLVGDVLPLYSIFEIDKAITDESFDKEVHHTSTGDVVCVTPFDRKFIYPKPENVNFTSPNPFINRG